MSKKSDAPALILALVVTLGLLGGGVWLLAQRFGGEQFAGNGTDSNNVDDGQTYVASKAGNAGVDQSGGSAIAGAASFTAVQNVPSGLFNYGGSTSWAPIRLSVDTQIQAARPELKLRYTNPIGKSAGSGTGIDMVINSEIAFAQSSRPITDAEYQKAQQRGITLKQIPVALDGIAAAVNPNLNVPGITVEQLTGIYTGAITNWQQVGGPNLAIAPLTRSADSGGTVDMVLRGNPTGSNVKIVNSTTQALRELANTPGGIYFASAPEVVPQCTIKPLPVGFQASNLVSPYQGNYVQPSQCPAQRNQLNVEAFRNASYPLTRNFFVIVKEDGSAAQQAGEAYANLLLSNDGQVAIEKAGFVRIR